MASFWGELRRRNVVRVGVVYAIVAWLLIEIATTVFPALKLPEWTATFVIALILIGFPIVLIGAWAFEITPEGVKPTREVPLEHSITHLTGRKFDFAIIGLLALAVVFLVVANYVWVEEEQPPPTEIIVDAPTDETTAIPEPIDRKSVAVLPFANRSKSEDDVFFVDGLHDDLLTHLSQIADMKVISRTSVMQYRDTKKNMKAIGDELDVATILEGGIQRAGNRVRINVQLIDARTDVHLWSQTYDETLTAENIFEIQTQIAMEIADRLQATLSPEEHDRLTNIPTKDLDAYEAYLRGRRLMDQRSGDSLRGAADLFQQAIDLDPNFAQAYAGLANAYILLFDWGTLSRGAMRSAAEPAIEKALALNDRQGEAFASLANLKFALGDHLSALADYKRGIELSPNYAPVYMWYAQTLLWSFGQRAQALAYFEKALALDPLSPAVKVFYAGALDAVGRHQEASRKLQELRQLHPHSALVYGASSWFGDVSWDEGIRWLRQAVAMEPQSPRWAASLGQSYMTLDDIETAAYWVERATRLGPKQKDVLVSQVALYAARGQLDAATKTASRYMDEFGGAELSIDADILFVYVQAGRYAEARERYLQRYPQLLSDNPRINSANAVLAIPLAYVLQRTGEIQKADQLLGKSLEAVPSAPRLGFWGIGIPDVEIYALRGETEAALNALRQAVDAGWTGDLGGPLLESIRNEPEFQAMMEEIRADMAAQLERVREMEASGELGPIPDVN